MLGLGGVDRLGMGLCRSLLTGEEEAGPRGRGRRVNGKGSTFRPDGHDGVLLLRGVPMGSDDMVRESLPVAWMGQWVTQTP